MRFAPEAFRSTRVETTEHVKAALLATNDLRTLNAATLKANPGALPTLRICAARRQRPSCGPAKLLDWLRPRHPGADLQRAIHALPTERISR
ncbi:MAG: hypothetical protein HY278_04070 [candidate division NC10 bacterium]|nr:hypothetical protein [candidate division NC10 bacterium]